MDYRLITVLSITFNINKIRLRTYKHVRMCRVYMWCVCVSVHLCSLLRSTCPVFNRWTKEMHWSIWKLYTSLHRIEIFNYTGQHWDVFWRHMGTYSRWVPWNDYERTVDFGRTSFICVDGAGDWFKMTTGSPVFPKKDIKNAARKCLPKCLCYSFILNETIS